MRPFNLVHFRAPRVIEALPGLSSHAKRCWPYIRFREYPDRPARIAREGADSFATDLALSGRTLQRALKELRDHNPPLLIVHRRGTKEGGPSEYHALLPGEQPPKCCLHKAAKLASQKKSQPAKSESTTRQEGALTGTQVSGCETISHAAGATCGDTFINERSKELVKEPKSPLATAIERIRKEGLTRARSDVGFEGTIVVVNGHIHVCLASGKFLEVTAERLASWIFT
jgi:hypothetical protein